MPLARYMKCLRNQHFPKRTCKYSFVAPSYSVYLCILWSENRMPYYGMLRVLDVNLQYVSPAIVPAATMCIQRMLANIQALFG